MAGLEPYSPRVLLEWESRFGASRHQAMAGTLVFADVSGFTKLSEKLERAGRVGAEQMAAVINGLFGELLMLAAVRGGEMLKYGGDAMLLFFEGDDHARRAVAACVDMQGRLRTIGRVDTGAGVVRLRMSVGAHSGSFDLFVCGGSHSELLVAGPDTTVTTAMETAADAGEILVSPATARLLSRRNVGPAKEDGFLVRGHPVAPVIDVVALSGSFDGSRFLDRRLVEYLSSDVPQPEHRLATVSFLQFLDVDALLVAGKADEAAERIDDALSLVQQCYDSYDVTFLATDVAPGGVKVMAATGAPVAYEEDDEHMLRASRAILDGHPALPVRIGINRGHVFAGDVGPTFRRTYTTLGDVTNTAARVMGRAAPGQCLVLDSVMQAATSVWACERLEPFSAKGKREPLVPWSLGAPQGRISRTSLSPLVGREAELAALLAELQASSGALRVVAVTGEPGLGKSRLVAEAVAHARRQDRPIFTIACDPFTATTPYRTIATLAVALDGPTDDDGLRRFVARYPDLERDLPLLGLALGLDLPPTATTGALDDAALPARIAAATASMLAVLLPKGSVVVVEDAHWTDQSSMAVLDALPGAASSSDAMLCVTRRDDGQGWMPSGPDLVIALCELDAAASLALIESASVRPLMPDEARRLAERAAGNPLFAEQLAAADHGAALPDSVEEVIASRIDQLPVASRDVLRRLAVLGPVFDADLVSAVVVEHLPEALDSYITTDGPRRRFTHALVQQTAYEGLSFKRRRELHAMVASHLMATRAADQRSEALALHCDAAAMWPEAWQYARDAAQAAEASYAFGIAAAHWERAARAGRASGQVPAAELADAWYACGEAYRRAGQLPDAAQAFRTGRKLSGSSSPQGISLAAAVGRALLLEGRVGAADRWARRAARELARIADPPFAVEAWVEELRAEVAHYYGRPARVITLARALAGKAARAGNLAVQARAQGSIHAASVLLGLPSAEQEGALALELAERSGEVRSLLAILSNLAEAADRRAEWDRAIALYERAATHAERGGFTLGGAIIDNNVAEILTRQGRLADALALFERSRRTAAAAGHWHAAFLTANVGWVLGLQGFAARATAAFDEATATLVDLGLTAVVPEVDERRVAVALLHGQPDVALALLRGSLAASAGEVNPERLAALSHAHRQLGERADALAAAELARAGAEEAQHAFGRLVAAEALFRLGQSSEAVAILEISDRLGIVARPALP